MQFAANTPEPPRAPAHDAGSHPLNSIKVFMSDPNPLLPAPATEYLSPEVFVVQPSNKILAAHPVTRDCVHHAGGGREDGIRLHSQHHPICAWRRIHSPFPGRLGASGTLQTVARHSFSATLLLILLAHEMGHYLYCCRYYGVYATLPLLHSGADADRHTGGGNSHTFTNSVQDARCLTSGSQGLSLDLQSLWGVLAVAMSHSRVDAG